MLCDRKEAAALSLRERLIVGTSSFGGLYESMSEEEVYATVKRALESGLKRYDTAPHYGLGLAEERLGYALARCKKEMDADLVNEIAIYTKIGRVISSNDVLTEEDHDRVEIENTAKNKSVFVDCPRDRVPILDYRKAAVIRSLNDSVSRLGLRSVQDLKGVRVHDPDISERYEAEAFPEAFCFLREQNHFEVSIGTNSERAARRAVENSLVDSIMLANSWNLLDQSGSTLLLTCHKLRVPVDLAGVYASGLLAGGCTYNYKPATESLLNRTKMWNTLAQKHGISLVAVALAFAFLPPAVRFIAIGLRSPGQVNDTIHLLETQVPRLLPPKGDLGGLWQEAIALHLLDETKLQAFLSASPSTVDSADMS